LTINPVPARPVLQGDTNGFRFFCQNPGTPTSVTIRLNPVQGVSFIWSGSSSGTGDTLKVMTNGNISIRAISNGCTSAVRTVQVQERSTPPAPLIFPQDPAGCIGYVSLAIQQPGVGQIYFWTPGNLQGPTAPINVVGNNMPYVAQTVVGGCTSQVSTPSNVTVYPQPPTPELDSVGIDTLQVTLPLVGGQYQWFFNTFPIDNKTSSKLKVLASGPYFVVVTNSNGCKDTSEVINITLVSNRNLAGQNGRVQIYPNPNSGTFTLSSDAPQNGERVEIFDAIGKLVYRQKMETRERVFDLRLPTGVYQLRIVGKDGRRYLEKLVIR
jgi:hypothetical protein